MLSLCEQQKGVTTEGSGVLKEVLATAATILYGYILVVTVTSVIMAVISE